MKEEKLPEKEKEMEKEQPEKAFQEEVVLEKVVQQKGVLVNHAPLTPNFEPDTRGAR